MNMGAEGAEEDEGTEEAEVAEGADCTDLPAIYMAIHIGWMDTPKTVTTTRAHAVLKISQQA